MNEQPSHIDISVETQFLPDRPSAEEHEYAFAYHILISNHGGKAVKLLSRYWLITDAEGHQAEVRGDGVVGEQPVIEPGESYQYTSGAILDTPVGSMQGYYIMSCEDGEQFKVPIAAFRLAVPSIIN